jgi:hypothetical protein
MILLLTMGPTACWFNDSSGGGGAMWQRHNVVDGGVVADLRGVWGSARDDVWAVGDEGTLLHFDGKAWTREESPLEETLNDVWGAAADDVWAVGERDAEDGFILHYDGIAWSVAYPRAGQRMVAVWGAGPDDVYALGGAEKPTLVVRYDGNVWREVGLPPGVSFGQDVWVHPEGAAFVAAFGDVARFDGEEWGVIAAGLEATHTAQAVWGSAPDDVFVAGSNSVIRHWDGAEWSRSVRFNVDDGLEVEIRGIWGESPYRVFAAGHLLGPDEEDPEMTVVVSSRVYSFDGSGWDKHALGNLDVALNAVWGSGDGDVWAVGDEGTILSY